MLKIGVKSRPLFFHTQKSGKKMKIILKNEAEKVAPICQKCCFFNFCEQVKIVYFDRNKRAIHIEFLLKQEALYFLYPVKKFILQNTNRGGNSSAN